MLCQKCGKNQATTHFKRTLNGETSEWHLCPSCAAEEGLDSMFSGLDLGNFWGSLFAEPAARAIPDTVRCEGCGHSFREIAQTGQAGCPACYTAFYDRLLPSIQRIHGKTRHVGKAPAGAGEPARREQELEQLRRQLTAAIAKQEYEECARLRDRIRELEGGDNRDEQ